MTSWIYLGIAVLFETSVAIAAGKAHGFTRLWWTIATLVSGAIATFFLGLALLEFDVGVGYAIWAGIGAVGSAVFGSVLFDQALNATQAFWLAIIIAGVIWLKLAGSEKLRADNRNPAAI